MAIPSINLQPSGYKNNKIYSVLPKNGDGDLDFTRASTATRVNKQGLIEEVGSGIPRLEYSTVCPSLLLEPQSTNLITYPLSFGNSYWTKSGASIQGDPSTAGSEEVTNGDFASDTDWNKNPNWTISGGSANSDGSASSNINQSFSAVEGNTYLVSFEITSYTSGNFDFFLGGINGVNRSAIGVYTEMVTASTSGGNLGIRPNGNAIGSIDNISVKEVQGFSAPSVDNPTGAFKLVPNSTSGNRYMYLSVNNALSTNSIFLKKGELSFAKVGNAAAVVVVDLDLGTLSKSTDSVNDYSIESFSNDWYRISIYNKLNSNFQMHFFAGVDSTGANVSTNGTDGIYIFGAQLEQQSYATNLMLPTTEGSTVTRLKDEASRTGLSNYINSEEGTLFVEMAVLAPDTINRYVSINDGTDDNSVSFHFRNNANNQVRAIVKVGNSNQFDLSYNPSGSTDYVKVALKYKANDFSFWVNGVEIGVDVSGISFAALTLNQISFNSGGGADVFYGNVKNLQVFKTALTDAELTTLTTI